jgi:DNA gyrase subunit A
MLITDGGVLVRTRVAEVKASSRVTMGVKLIALDGGAQLAGLQKVAESVIEAAEGLVDPASAVAGDGVADGALDVPPEGSGADDPAEPLA